MVIEHLVISLYYMTEFLIINQDFKMLLIYHGKMLLIAVIILKYKWQIILEIMVNLGMAQCKFQ
jgi:hypothetical protein